LIKNKHNCNSLNRKIVITVKKEGCSKRRWEGVNWVVWKEKDLGFHFPERNQLNGIRSDNIHDMIIWGVWGVWGEERRNEPGWSLMQQRSTK
jgi:hypothetical protein